MRSPLFCLNFETMSTHSLGPEVKMLLFQTEAKTQSQATVMLIQEMTNVDDDPEFKVVKDTDIIDLDKLEEGKLG